MNLKNRFRLAIFCMIALLVSIALIVAIGVWHTNEHLQESIGMDDLIVNLYELRTLNKEYLAAPSERVKQQWRTIYAQVNRRLVEQQNIPDDVKDAVNGLQQLFERLISLPDVSPDMKTSQKRLRNQLATTLNLESQRVIDWAAGISRHTKDSIARHVMMIGAVTLAVLLVASIIVIAIMFFTARHILASINRLREGAEEIAGGRLGFQVEQAGSDEIATLATAVNRMSHGLMNSYQNLQERTVQLETEMAERQTIHDALQIKTLELGEEIKERMRAEEELRENEERFRTLSDKTPLGMSLVDIDGRYQYVNPAFVKIFGYELSDIPTGKEWFIKAFPDTEYRRGVMADWKGDLSRYPNLEIRPRTYEVKCKDDAFRTIMFKPVALPTGEQLIIYEDMTSLKREEEERRSLEERLQRAEKMEALGQLAGGVAHDLNNVLGILTGYSELLRDEIPAESQSRVYVDKILQSTGKGAAIIQDLLTLARRGVTVADVINLNSVVKDFLDTPVFEKMKEYHPLVTFRMEYDKDLLNIKGSPVHLEKTVMNLVSNAAEAITEAGEVTIRTESRRLDQAISGYDEVQEGDYAVLTVSDTGMGIPAENRQKIFEPFFTKKTMGRSGTGLGLAIVWGTVKDHHGYIDIQTEVGQGTTFTLYFPVTQEGLSAPQEQEPIEQYMGNGESVLVVDDIADQREIASRLLTRLGYKVHLIASGEEAVEYLKGNKADILLLDMIMTPGIDGLETYQRILEIKPRQKTILVSGFTESDRAREAQQLGAGAYIKKPYILERIGVAIRDELLKDPDSGAK